MKVRKLFPVLGLLAALACADDTSKDKGKKDDKKKPSSSEHVENSNSVECNCDLPCLCSNPQWSYLTPPSSVECNCDLPCRCLNPQWSYLTPPSLPTPRPSLMGYGELVLPAGMFQTGARVSEAMTPVVNAGLTLLGYSWNLLYYGYAIVARLGILAERLFLTGEVQPYHLAGNQQQQPEPPHQIYEFQNTNENSVVNTLTWILDPEGGCLDHEAMESYAGLLNQDIGPLGNLLSMAREIYGEDAIGTRQISAEKQNIFEGYFKQVIMKNILIVSDETTGVMLAAFRTNTGKVLLYLPLLNKVYVLNSRGVAARTILTYFGDVIKSFTSEPQCHNLYVITIPASNEYVSDETEEVLPVQKQRLDPDPEDVEDEEN